MDGDRMNPGKHRVFTIDVSKMTEKEAIAIIKKIMIKLNLEESNE